MNTSFSHIISCLAVFFFAAFGTVVAQTADTPTAIPAISTPDASTSLQVDAPSVVLPTPPLPAIAPLPEAPPSPAPTPGAITYRTPAPEMIEFSPPTASSLNLPSAAVPGSPSSAPASSALPDMKGVLGGGALGGLFDWAKQLLFQAAVRAGYDSNPNSLHSNVVGSIYSNLNGGINYRCGTPRLKVNATLTGGITTYPNIPNNKLQGQLGLGFNIEYRYRPRLVLAIDSSSSYQAQPNQALGGGGGFNNSPSIYSANSVSASYQINDIWTSVTRASVTGNFYLQNAPGGQQGFVNPNVTQSLRYLFKPTTTLVADMSSDLYTYGSAGLNSHVQTLDAGFDHTFSPKLTWNFRGGAQLISYQNPTRGSGTTIGPSIDNTVSYAFGKSSSVSWITHVGSQPSSQQNVSYSESVRTGLNYTQRLATKINLNIGAFYLISNFKDAPYGVNGASISYKQNSAQGNINVSYQINRILALSLGYQYMACTSPAVPSQEYNRGISFVQLSGGF